MENKSDNFEYFKHIMYLILKIVWYALNVVWKFLYIIVIAYPVNMIFDDCGLQKIMISIPSLPKHDPPKEILDSMIHDPSHLVTNIMFLPNFVSN